MVAIKPPHKGDLVSIYFEVQGGHEQHGWRPSLVISNDLFNSRTGMAFVCPITQTDRGYPFHVALGETAGITGHVMVDQVRSIDFAARRAKFLGSASDRLVAEVLAILDACMY